MKKFWMVYRVGSMGPTCHHETQQSAEREAERLAMSLPGEKLIVLEAVKGVVRNDVRWVNFDESNTDDIPF